LKNSVALVRERTVPTELPPLVGEANLADRGESRGQRVGSLPLYSQVYRPKPLLFLPSTHEVDTKD
jgi:hypothetical protein